MVTGGCVDTSESAKMVGVKLVDDVLSFKAFAFAQPIAGKIIFLSHRIKYNLDPIRFMNIKAETKLFCKFRKTENFK